MAKQDYDALVLAAGFGTRLAPLTDTIPKPLIEVAGRPMLDRCLSRLAAAGGKRVVINLHYLADAIAAYVGDGSQWGIEVVFSREDPILDTGGAVRRAEQYFVHDDVVVMNSDIVLGDDFSVEQLLAVHRAEPDTEATLVLRSDPRADSFGPVDASADGRIVGFLNKEYAPCDNPARYMFTGVSVLSRTVIQRMPADGSVFSLTQDTFVEELTRGSRLSAVVYEGYWNDVGTHERLAEANDVLSR